MRSDLERLARELEVEGRVHFLGYRRDVVDVIAAADVAVLSSEKEGTPVSLIEAAAAGRPAVATAVGGVPEVVTPETGILVSPGDEIALARGMSQIAGDAELRRALGQRASARVRGRYSVDRMVRGVTALYDELVGAGSPL